MPARTLGATAVAAALVLLPTASHATGPSQVASSAVVSAEESRRTSAAPASTAISTDSLVTVGLVVLVGGALALVLAGRRTNDDEPSD